MRLKENADDYRYFPDPDLPAARARPRRASSAIRAALPELPDARRARFAARATGSPTYDARLLTASRALADFFEAAARGARHAAKAVANWLLRDVLGGAARARASRSTRARSRRARFAALLRLVDEGSVTRAERARARCPSCSSAAAIPRRWCASAASRRVSDAGALERRRRRGARRAADAAVAATAAATRRR